MQQLNLNNSYTSGHIAEFISRFFLRLKGYKILKSRFIIGRGTNAGEIDIIAKRGKNIIFIEVKKRQTINLAMEVIFQKQMKRISKSAEIFLAKNPQYNNYNCRFDAICFNKYYKFKHIKNAWIL